MAFERKGYGQVEPNHLSAQRTGQIYAQRPCADGMTQLENGQFVKYTVVSGKEVVAIDASAPGEWMLVYNEEKLYDERHQMHKDFVFKAADFYDGKMFPRVFRVEAGDIFTTNCFGVAATSADGVTNMSAKFDKDTHKFAKINTTTGFLEGQTSASGADFAVVKVYTMPDGQDGVKLQKL